MPRVCFDDALWADARFLKLVGALKEPMLAAGAMVMAMRLAQKHWIPEKQGVPKKDWEESGLPEELVSCGLARHQEDGTVYVVGSEEAFAWYFDRVESGRVGGLKSALKRKERQKNTKKKSKRKELGEISSTPQAPLEHTSSTPQALLNQTQPYSYSSSYSYSSKEEEKKNTFLTESVRSGELTPSGGGGVPEKASGKKFSEPTREKMRAFIAAYSEAYRKKYNAPPEGIRDKALIGKLGHWIETVSTDRAVQLVQVYLQLDQRQVTESCHDLWLFFRNLNRIGIALDTGSSLVGINWDAVFRGAS